MDKVIYRPIIGLEVHIELKTKSKMFCYCSAEYFGHEPNTHCCPVCLGLPGTLPVPNKTAIEWCLKIGLALNCKIPPLSKFDRKNYFYPDLPKGYQISQYDEPFCIDGWIELNKTVIANEVKQSPQEIAALPSVARNDKKQIKIRRVHMEEDTAKLLHAVKDGEKSTLIDFNRSGVPLVEIVTEPDFESGKEVKEYVQKLQQIVRYLGVSDADMEKGEMRLEPNISLKIKNQKSKVKTTNQNSKLDEELPSYKVEVKNINSFKFVEKAIDYEIERQEKILEEGKIPEQETRGWDEKKQITVSQRTKEEAHDYRYFPEPDIPPLRWSQDQISKIKNQIPELPDAKISRFMKNYQLSEYDANLLTTSQPTADYFEEAVRAERELSTLNSLPRRQAGQLSTKTIANWIINKKVDINNVLPAELIQTILQQTQVSTISEEELKKVVVQVLLDNPKAVSDYKKGKIQALEFLIGEIMTKIKKKVSVQNVRKILKKVIHG